MDRPEIAKLLGIGGIPRKLLVQVLKILHLHSNNLFKPLYEWEFKVCPIIGWFGQTAIGNISWFQCTNIFAVLRQNVKQMKLSAMYKFVWGLPTLYVKVRLIVQVKELGSRKSSTS